MKRAIVWIITAALLAGLCACGAPAETTPEPAPEPVPEPRHTTAAEPSLLYADGAEWSADATRARVRLALGRCALGRLCTPEGLLTFAERLYAGELPRRLARLESYLRLRQLLGGEEALPDMEEQWAALSAEREALLADARTELLALGAETRAELLQAEALTPYAGALRALTGPAAASPVGGQTARLLREAQTAPEFTMPSGKTKPLTEAQFYRLLRGDYDRNVLKSAENAFFGRSAAVLPELAALLHSRLLGLYTAAEAAEAELSDYAARLAGRERAELAAVTEAARALYPALRDYARSYGIIRGYAPLLSQLAGSCAAVSSARPYEEAVDAVIAALAPTGENGDALFASGHVGLNAPETGLFPAGAGETPFALLSRKESEIPVGELAGLAYEAALLRRGRAPADSDGAYAALTAELWLLERAETQEEKQTALECLLSRLTREALLPALFTELEEYLFAQVEAGYAPNGEDVSEKCYGLLRDCVGDSVELGEGARYLWTEEDGLFDGYASCVRASETMAAAERAWQTVRGAPTDFSTLYTTLAEEYAAIAGN